MTYQTINPATGKLIATYANIADQDLSLALDQAHLAFKSIWRECSIADRANIISTAANLLRKKGKEYASYLTLEMGKLTNEAQAEVNLSADILDYYAMLETPVTVCNRASFQSLRGRNCTWNRLAFCSGLLPGIFLIIK